MSTRNIGGIISAGASDGIRTPPTAVEYLVVAGGGGGGGNGSAATQSRAAGGGGAGGLRTDTGFSVTIGSILTVTIGAGGDVSGGGGSLNIKTGDHLLITGDLEVDGHLEAYSVGAVRVDARAGIGCGIGDLGNPLKGRLPTPPLGIFSATTITAGLAVLAPVGTFGLMDAILMTDLINTSIYGAHIHIGFKGPTGPPIPSMI